MTLCLLFILLGVFVYYYVLLLSRGRYLQEVGYSDTILDVRSQRVRALLGSTYDVTNKDNDNKLINGDSPAQDKQK